MCTAATGGTHARTRTHARTHAQSHARSYARVRSLEGVDAAVKDLEAQKRGLQARHIRLWCRFEFEGVCVSEHSTDQTVVCVWDSGRSCMS